MHLLFLSERYPPDIGGVAASGGRISRALAGLGHTVTVVTLTRALPAGGVERQPLGDRLTLHRLGQSKNLDFSLQQALTYLEWLHRQTPFALVWGHYVQTAGFLAAWLGKTLALPSVLAIRGNDLDRQLFPPGDLARLEWCLRQASHLVTVSGDLARKVTALCDRQATVLPNAVDTDLFCPGPRPGHRARQLDLPEGELVLGFSGELRAKKGLPFLLQAVQEVRQHIPARLLVIGAVRPTDQGEYERLLIGLGLRGAITLTGHIDEPEAVAEHLRLCDLFLLPSLWEGMPNGLLEAMACGLPVIASDAGGIPEIVIDHVNGLLVPRTHLHRLGRRIVDCLRLSDAERRRLGDAARQTTCDHHSLAAERSALTKLLSGVARSPS